MRDPALFTLTVLLILGMPGPTNALLATSGGTVGFRRSLPLVPAEAGGYLIATMLIGLALGPVIAAVPAIAQGLRLAVIAYLFYLCVKLWRHESGARITTPISPGQVFVTTLLNPKAILLALGVIPFAGGGWWLYMLCFLALVAGMSLAWIAFGSMLLHVMGRGGHARMIPRLGALTVAIFATLLLVKPFWR